MERITALGRRVLAWAIIAAAVILVVRLTFGAIIGLVHAVLLIVALIVVGLAVLWSLGQVRRDR